VAAPARPLPLPDNAAPAPRPDDVSRDASRDATLASELRRYTPDLYRLRPGNTAALLRGGGETFPAMVAAIAAAHRTVHLETYIFDDDRTGRRIADALIERARAGVTVRVIYDSLGGLGMARAFVHAMQAAGIALVEYHPVAPWRKRFNLSRRDHRKILVVDDAIGFSGGLNLSNAWAATADGGAGWHDMHCELRGPVVADLGRLFRKNWLASGGAAYPVPPSAGEMTVPPGTVAARVVDNQTRRRRGAIRRAYLAAIAAAERTVLLENAYFLPDRGVRRALYAAVARGVEVAVIVPGDSNLKPVEYAGWYLARELVGRGVQVLRWQGTMMHAKTAVVDRTWACVGSYNFDARSARYNLEVVVEVIDRDFAATVEQQFALDRTNTRAFDLAAWRALAWWRKAAAWCAFSVRRWL
jgi:cardiolipin synthase A/B